MSGVSLTVEDDCDAADTRMTIRADDVEIDFACPPCEFGLELAFACGHAYWLYLNGRLKSTSSLVGTRALYYFSPRHFERAGARQYMRLDLPNSSFQTRQLNKRTWSPPPYRDHFGKMRTAFTESLTKPLAVVCNKYADEWGRGPVHFIPAAWLRDILETLRERFCVVYSRPAPSQGEGYTHDHNECLNTTEDVQVVRGLQKNPDDNLHLFEDLVTESSLDYNTFQFILFAHAELAVTVQGGCAVVAATLCKRCIIYAKEGVEVRCGSYYTWFRDLGGADIKQCPTLDALLRDVKKGASSACR